MSKAEIELDDQTYQQVRRDLAEFPGRINQALKAGVAHATMRGRTVVVDELAAVLNAKRSVIRRRVHADKYGAEGVVTASHSQIGLIEFSGTKDTTNRHAHSGRGVMAQVYQSGGARDLPHAFIGKMKSGKRAVFQRAAETEFSSLSPSEKLSYRAGLLHYRKAALVRNKLSQSGLVGRFPILFQSGPSPASAMREHPDIEAKSRARIAGTLREQVLSQVDRILQRKKIDRPLDEAA